MLFLLQVDSKEMTTIVDAYKDTSEPKKVQSQGFHVAGVRYVVIKADDRSLYGMKVQTTTCLLTKSLEPCRLHPSEADTSVI